MAFIRGAANIGTHAFIPVKFSKKVAAILDNIVVAMDCVNTEWENEILESGDIVRIRSFGNITVNSYTVDQTITNQTVSESAQSLVIDQQQYFSFKIDDIDVKQTDLDVYDGYEERASVAVRDIVDTFLLTQMAASAPAYNTIGATSAGSVIQLNADNIYDVFVDLYERLETSKVFGATSQRPWTIVPPKVKAIMKKSGQLGHATDKGDEVIRNGVVGEFAGFDVKTTTNMNMTPASGGNDDYFGVIAGTNLGYTFAMQISKVEDLRMETTFADQMRGLFVYGGQAVVPGALAKLVCKI